MKMVNLRYLEYVKILRFITDRGMISKNDVQNSIKPLKIMR